MRDVLIGIDAGTSVIKSIAFDLEGNQLAVAALPNRYETIDGRGAEQDLARTWQDTATTLRQLGEKVPDLARRTAAVSVTGQGDGTWLIDRDGKPVGKGWLWLDARAADIVEQIRAREDADALRYSRTGSGLAACQQGPQLALMAQTAPERLQQAATAFHCKDWLYFCMTGERATDPSEGCFTFGDFRSRSYSDDVIEVLGLKHLKHLLPPIVDGSRQSAELSPGAADASGLLAGTPVVLGYVDVVCTALGVGLFDRTARPGCSIIGSTGMHIRLAPTAGDVRLGSGRTGYTMCLPAPDAYAQCQTNMAATLNIDWVLGLANDVLSDFGLPQDRSVMLALVNKWFEAGKPGAILYHPYISEAGERGPFTDASASASFIGLTSRHNYGDLVRAVVDGIAFASYDCYSAMGEPPAEVRLSGGAARSSAMRRILGAVLNTHVRSSRREEAGAAGTAMIAAVGLGHYKSMEDCVAAWAAPLLGAAEAPDTGLATAYHKMFPSYLKARQALKPVWHDMANARTKE